VSCRAGRSGRPLFESIDQDRVYIGLVEPDPHTTYLRAVQVLEEAGVTHLLIAKPDWDNAPDLPLTAWEAVRAEFSGRIRYAAATPPSAPIA
jgi:hypothetical protein